MDEYFFTFELSRRKFLVDFLRRAFFQNLDVTYLEIYFIEVEFGTASPRRRNDATPVRISSMDGCFYKGGGQNCSGGFTGIRFGCSAGYS